ncbi:uncharacterized protein DUF4360 [Actinomadura pelletieri DSM 43383]|uniref:Uncharacterized protein DUF4360 n=1 Tax=Actinomadura pelletieri DSM 43383 TaxID=1120940 RepID=A0A495QT62_9ACTN|nr:DUF4360 domain-containing protein [Actinomadura pelletieri]RKS76690.1 uncharacterized protein DUF4360 [Actinomadura pelletieri DSM 43383]
MRKRIPAYFAAGMLAMTAVTVAPAAASGQVLAHGPDGVTVDVATVNGSGCPIGSAAVALSESSETFTVTYSEHLARVGGNSKPTDERRNCQLNLRVHVPQGFVYAISQVDYRGYISLRKGASASLISSYYFQGDSRTRHYQRKFSGPLEMNYQSTDMLDVTELVWSPCGEQRNFNINTQLLVDIGTSDKSEISFISLDSTDGNIKTTYHFTWKRC